MDGVYIVLMRDTDNVFNIKISIDRALAFADKVGFVSFVAVQWKCVFFWINCHCADAEFVAGTENADSDFAAVGNQYRLNFLHSIPSFG